MKTLKVVPKWQTVALLPSCGRIYYDTGSILILHVAFCFCFSCSLLRLRPSSSSLLGVWSWWKWVVSFRISRCVMQRRRPTPEKDPEDVISSADFSISSTNIWPDEEATALSSVGCSPLCCDYQNLGDASCDHNHTTAADQGNVLRGKQSVADTWQRDNRPDSSSNCNTSLPLAASCFSFTPDKWEGKRLRWVPLCVGVSFRRVNFNILKSSQAGLQD